MRKHTSSSVLALVHLNKSAGLGCYDTSENEAVHAYANHSARRRRQGSIHVRCHWWRGCVLNITNPCRYCGGRSCR